MAKYFLISILHKCFYGPYESYEKAEGDRNKGDIIVKECYPENRYGAPKYPGHVDQYDEEGET